MAGLARRWGWVVVMIATTPLVGPVAILALALSVWRQPRGGWVISMILERES